MSKDRRKIRIVAAAAVLLVVAIWLVAGNFTVKTTRYVLNFDSLPKSFDGFTIAQISDLHNAEFGRGNSALLDILKKEEPDIIAITGDIADSSRTDVGVAASFAENASMIAPCLYVTGNHEANIDDYTLLEMKLTGAGVTILHDSSLEISRDDDAILIAGIDDPMFATMDAGNVSQRIDIALGENDSSDIFTLLLTHRPEYFDDYVHAGVDLALAGHTHGGQIRLPFFGGLYAPGQGFFPMYDSGNFASGDTTMIVSRGIGNSVIPVRVNDTPEIVMIELKCGQK